MGFGNSCKGKWVDLDNKFLHLLHFVTGNNTVDNLEILLAIEALTLKEIMLFEPGDYVVHVDHGVGQFAGLVRIPGADGAMQEVIKITYQKGDAIFVSIHALHKVSKYKGKEGEPPRLSSLGTGAWEKLKGRTKEKLKDKTEMDALVAYLQGLGVAFKEHNR